MERTLPDERNQPLPFITYPKDEAELRKSIWIGANCRHEYGLKFIQKTHQSCCAYCGKPLTKCYDAWVTMVLDHVVPLSVCEDEDFGIKPEFCWSLANAVLACTTCNGFDNQYKPSSKRQIKTFQEFLNLRDEIFVKRRERIQEKHKEEKAFFEREIAHVFD
jgi:5-methylcytosine-specific restriction endonuclease McrA